MLPLAPPKAELFYCRATRGSDGRYMESSRGARLASINHSTHDATPHGEPLSQETGGPPVVAPSKSSYGTSIIRDLIP
jgi:hypothetical protein